MAHQFKLIVFNLQKAENIGALIRSAYAFGCEEVLVVGRRRFKVTGASKTHDYQKQRHFHQLSEAVAYCREAGYTVWGVEIGGEPLHEVRFDENVALILGNEGKGLSDAEPYCDRILSIPQWGGVPSLNVAVAGSIAMYSFAVQQGRPPARQVGDRYVDTHFSLPTHSDS